MQVPCYYKGSVMFKQLAFKRVFNSNCNVQVLYFQMGPKQQLCSGASHYMRKGSQRHNISDGVKTIGSFLWPNS